MKIFFHGKILPERADVHIQPFKINLISPENNFDAMITFSAKFSQISLTVDGKIEIDIFTLRHSLEQKVRNFVDIYGYISGRGYDIELTTATYESGEQIVFGVGFQDLEEQQDQRPFDFPTTLNLVTKNEHLANALGNLREALRMPWDTYLFCYRAIECIRQEFYAETEQEKGWEKMKTELNISKDEINFFKDNATHQRHGGRTLNITPDRRSKTLLTTWGIVDKFSVYLKKREDEL